MREIMTEYRKRRRRGRPAPKASSITPSHVCPASLQPSSLYQPLAQQSQQQSQQ
jgi:hypothetical protein